MHNLGIDIQLMLIAYSRCKYSFRTASNERKLLDLNDLHTPVLMVFGSISFKPYLI